MTKISVAINNEINSKLLNIAKEKGCSIEECVALALAEYVENCNDIYITDLNSINNMERSFFLSAGE